ncbi:MAG: hypothetical protein JWN62_1341 [Acidimicrobiales bacterium]|nr:hypothetical protein [Acidimicrobiales bacterium]
MKVTGKAKVAFGVAVGFALSFGIGRLIGHENPAASVATSSIVTTSDGSRVHAAPYDAEADFIPVTDETGNVYRDGAGQIVLFRQSAFLSALDAYGADHNLHSHRDVVKDPDTGESNEVVTTTGVALYKVVDRVGERDRKAISDEEFATLDFGPTVPGP